METSEKRWKNSRERSETESWGPGHVLDDRRPRGHTRSESPLFSEGPASYSLDLFGTFRLHAPTGQRISVSSKKGRAIVAILSLATGGERTRAWLQDRLWGSRQKAQAQQSLRNELASLRRALEGGGERLLYADNDRVRLDLSRIRVDALEWLEGGSSELRSLRRGEFLEGLDIAGEEGFEEWLREHRQMFEVQPDKGEAAPMRANGGLAPARPSACRVATDEHHRPRLELHPLLDRTGQPSVQSVAQGFELELLDRLSRLRWIAVRAASHPESPDGRAKSPDYQVAGQILAKRQRFAFSLGLTEGASRRMIWSRQIDLPSELDQDSLDRAARDFVAALDAQVEGAEQERVLDRPVESLSADDLVWRARWHLNRLTRADAALAEMLVQRIRAERPNMSEGLILAAFSMAWSIWTGRQPEARVRELRGLALRAVAADPFDARGHLLIGMAETWLRQPIRARLALEHAIELNPSLCQAYMQLGSALYLAGDPTAALGPMETALQLNPHDCQIFCVFAELGMVHCMIGEYAKSAEYADLSLIRKPGYWFAHVVKVNALARSGNGEGARRAHADLLSAKPNLAEEQVDWLPFVDPVWRAFLKEGLRQAAGG